MAIDRTKVDWKHVGRFVERGRLEKGWSKEQAAREADISSITWKRIEDGERVQDAKLAMALQAIQMGLHLPGTEPSEVVALGIVADDGLVTNLYEQGSDVGGDDDASPYVSKADPAAGKPTREQDDEVLRAVLEMREELRALSERVERLESS